MPGASRSTQLSVSTDASGASTLHHDGYVVPAHICQQSATLAELLETDGRATLPMPPELLHTWIRFAAVPNRFVAAEKDASSLPSLARLIEVSHFMRNAGAEDAAAAHAATLLRRAFRHDLIHNNMATAPAVGPAPLSPLLFPAALPAHPGPQLQAAVGPLPPLGRAAAAAIARHLSLTEALLLPPPFPAEALAHFLTITGGVLDLSPPRVPAHNPDGLARITRALAPLLPHGPLLTALHIPAPCLTCPDAATPLLPYLSTLTRLCITHGKVTYDDLSGRSCLDTGAAVALLSAASPAALRHLSIDAALDADPSRVHDLLATFTAVTALRLQVLPHACALRTMPRLECLSLTCVPDPKGDSVDAMYSNHLSTRREIAQAPCLRHMHVSGSMRGVADLNMGFYREDQVDKRPMVPPVAASNARHDGRGGNVGHCCGFPVSEGAVSLRAEAAGLSGAASTFVHFFGFREIWDAWGPAAARGPRQGRGAAAAATAEGLHTLTLLMLRWEESLTALVRRLLTGEAQHTLRALCVLRRCALPRRSALDVSRGARGCAWVTVRSSGVAHPLCALEMLHYNGAPNAWGPCGPRPSGTALAGNSVEEQAPGFLTLRLSLDVLPVFAELILTAAPGCLCSTVRDLSLHGAPRRATDISAPDLSCLPLLPHLRTLSLDGIPSPFERPHSLLLPPALTALHLRGTAVSAAAPLGELGGRLRHLRALQCLDVEVTVEVPAGTHVSSRPADGGVEEEVACDGAAEMRAALWAGLQPVLLGLPLRLGACVSVRRS